MKHIKSIDLIFENTDYLTVELKHVGHFDLKNLHRHTHRSALNAIGDFTVVDDVEIELFSEGNKLTYMQVICPHPDDNDGFKRIAQWNDITGIELHFDDGTVETVYPDYDEGDGDYSLGAPNIHQTSKISSLGNLYIVISKDKTVDDVFPDEEIENAKEIQHKKEMYGVYDPDWNSMTEEEKIEPIRQNRYARLKTHKKHLKQRYAGHMSIQNSEEKERRDAEESSGWMRKRYPSLFRNGGYCYWLHWPKNSRRRKHYKRKSNAVIRAKYKDLHKLEDPSDIIAPRQSDYEKEYDYWWEMD